MIWGRGKRGEHRLHFKVLLCGISWIPTLSLCLHTTHSNPKIQKTFRAKSILGYLQPLFWTWGTRILQKWNPGLHNTRCDGQPVTLARPVGGDKLSLGYMKLHLKKIKQHKNKEANYLWGIMLGIKTSKIVIIMLSILLNVLLILFLLALETGPCYVDQNGLRLIEILLLLFLKGWGYSYKPLCSDVLFILRGFVVLHHFSLPSPLPFFFRSLSNA